MKKCFAIFAAILLAACGGNHGPKPIVDSLPGDSNFSPVKNIPPNRDTAVNNAPPEKANEE